MENKIIEKTGSATAGDIAKEIIKSFQTPPVSEPNPTKSDEVTEKANTTSLDEETNNKRIVAELDEEVNDDEIFYQSKIKRKHLQAIQKRDYRDSSIRATEFWQFTDTEFETNGRF